MRELTRSAAVALVLGLVAGVAAAVVAHLAGHSIRPWLACVLAVSAALLIAALHESWHRVLGAEPAAPARPERVVLTDRKRGGLDVTVRMIERATSDPDRFEILRARLTQLTEERLRTTRGVDVRADPERARTLVGDGLVGLFAGRSGNVGSAGRPARPPGRAELEDWMTRLEAL